MKAMEKSKEKRPAKANGHVEEMWKDDGGKERETHLFDLARSE